MTPRLPDAGETLTIISVGPHARQRGTVVIDGSALRYAPKADFFGTETFTYIVEDGHGGTATATVTVTVDNVNDDPTANDDHYHFIANTGAPRLERAGQRLDRARRRGDADDHRHRHNERRRDRRQRGRATAVHAGRRLRRHRDVHLHDQRRPRRDGHRHGDRRRGGLYSQLAFRLRVHRHGRGQRAGRLRAGSRGRPRATHGDRLVRGRRVPDDEHRGGRVLLFHQSCPGSYTITETQPACLRDGAERLGTQGGSIPANDKFTVVIPTEGGVVGLRNNFVELGMEAQYFGIWDFLNTSTREGILFATDTASGPLWFSLMDGWEGFVSARRRSRPTARRFALRRWT